MVRQNVSCSETLNDRSLASRPPYLCAEPQKNPKSPHAAKTSDPTDQSFIEDLAKGHNKGRSKGSNKKKDVTNKKQM